MTERFAAAALTLPWAGCTVTWALVAAPQLLLRRVLR